MHKSWLCVSWLALFSPPVLASTVYPPVVQEELELAHAPECELCHTTSRGGPNTARKPFARTLMDLGLTGSANVTKLRALLPELNDSDSDNDGLSDISELQRGSDPNDAASVPAAPTTPPSGVDAGSDAQSVVDGGEVPTTDGSVHQAPTADARAGTPVGVDTDGGVSSATTSTSAPPNDAQVEAQTPNQPTRDEASSKGCAVTEGEGAPHGAWLAGLAAVLLLSRQRAKTSRRK